MVYVMSDLHGQYKRFDKMLKKINFSSDDTLYILGDAIDRGPDSMKIIQTIMEMKNIIFLIGNHEHMMLESLQDNSKMNLWFINKGFDTYKQFISLPKNIQYDIYDYLYSRILVIPNLKVSNQHYYLTHSSPLKYHINFPKYYADVSDEEKYFVLWERYFNSKIKHTLTTSDIDLINMYKGHILVCGHTKTQSVFFGNIGKNNNGRISYGYHGHVIDIDCGCASNKNLGCIRLDDKKTYYTF